MLPSPSILLGLCLGFAQINAHFLLNYPATVGFDDDNEGNAPCGGFNVTFDNTTNFHVGGDAIALTSTHPAATWLFRATLDTTAGGNWSNLLPAVGQESLGNFCEPGITVPASFAGQKGVIQVVQDAVDGLLFQCAAVNFVSGVNPSIPTTCQNVTGLQASFTTDPTLSSIAGAATATGSSGATPSASKSASAPAVGEYAAASLFWGVTIAIGSVVAAIGL